jgi:hypothetical protein
MLMLPVFFAPADNHENTASVPFATVAIAGHNLAGGWCDCGAPGCICDPGENQGGNSARPISDDSPSQRNPKAKSGRVSELDFGTGAFLIGLALFMWSRLRA